MNRPNILFIFTDQQTAGAMSVAGNTNLATPNMDALAASGVRFSLAYCAHPLCIPSRSTMMTGVMPHTHSVTTNRGVSEKYAAGVASGRWPMLGQLLSDGGYQTGYFGKWHLPVSEDAKALHGFSSVNTSADPDLPKLFSRWLNERERDRPFFATVSLMNPHNICEWARGEMLRDAVIPPPPVAELCPPLPENFEPASDEPGWIREFQRRRAHAYIASGFDVGQWRQYLWAYYRLVEAADAQIGRILAGLRGQGLEENTTVVFSSDHGDGCAAHRWCQKQVLYEESMRVPLILRPAGGVDSGVDDRLVNVGQDLLPTLLDYAEVPKPPSAGGISLRQAAEVAGERREYVIGETEFCPGARSLGAGGRMLRTTRYKYCIYTPLTRTDRNEQFFDLLADPGETVNRIGEPALRDEVSRHRALLHRWQEEHSDDFLLKDVSQMER